jgi:hypothetical protein
VAYDGDVYKACQLTEDAINEILGDKRSARKAKVSIDRQSEDRYQHSYSFTEPNNNTNNTGAASSSSPKRQGVRIRLGEKPKMVSFMNNKHIDDF